MSSGTTSSRDRILGRIKTGTRASERTVADEKILEARIRAPERHIVPEQFNLEGKAKLEYFIAKAEGQGTSIARVRTPEDALAEVRDYLRQNNLPQRIVASPSEALADLGLDDAGDLEVRRGAAVKDDMTSVTPVYRAVAETGTIVTRSGTETPSTLNFVPEYHIAVLREKDLVASYEDSWDAIREKEMPRTVNWISGPSRSGDIGMTMFMGAHGPRAQHVIIIEDD